jgi:ABC-type phosphate/phosphonate transport system substrate-binding protein
VLTTRIAAIGFAAAASLVVVATLSGCSSSAGGSTNTLANAKATTLATETKMESFIPRSSIISVIQPKQSKVIFPCLQKQNESYWPSTMTVSLKPGLNTGNLLDAIGDYWTNKTGWSVSNSTAPDGTPTMSIVSNSGYNYTAEFAQGPVFTVTAISECFPSAGMAGKSSY